MRWWLSDFYFTCYETHFATLFHPYFHIPSLASPSSTHADPLLYDSEKLANHESRIRFALNWSDSILDNYCSQPNSITTPKCERALRDGHVRSAMMQNVRIIIHINAAYFCTKYAGGASIRRSVDDRTGLPINVISTFVCFLR